MIALLGLVLPVIGNIFPALFGYLGKKQDVTLSGAQSGMAADVNLSKAYFDAQIQAEQIKVANNQWIGPKIIACAAGELSLIYYGAIVLDSMFKFGWAIDKLPEPWAGYSWIILSSFIVVSPVAPVLSATATWLGRK